MGVFDKDALIFPHQIELKQYRLDFFIFKRTNLFILNERVK